MPDTATTIEAGVVTPVSLVHPNRPETVVAPVAPVPVKITQDELVARFVSVFGTGTDEAIVEAYRNVHVSRRGDAANLAGISFLGGGGEPAEYLRLVNLLNDAPKATASRVTAPFTDDERATIKIYASVAAVVGNGAAFVVTFGGAPDDEDRATDRAFIESHQDVVDATIKKVRTFIGNLVVGSQGHTDHGDSFTDYVPAGSTLTATYKGVAYSATVQDDGTVTSGSVTGSPSSVATKITGQKAVNGWKFWTFNGSTIGALRNA